MKKSELREKIKSVFKNYSNSSNEKKSNEVKKIDLDSAAPISLDGVRFPVLAKFPTLRETIVKLLTNQYDLFIQDIEWVAPKPTTFRIVLANDQPFYLIYTDRTWIGKVEGKKYYLLNLNDEQNCVESIARILSYGPKVVKPKEDSMTPPAPTAPPETPPQEPKPEEPQFEEPNPKEPF